MLKEKMLLIGGGDTAMDCVRTSVDKMLNR